MNIVTFLSWVIFAVLLSACSSAEVAEPETVVKSEEGHPYPVYECDSLSPKAVEGEDNTVQYRVDYTAYAAATLKAITYNHGDGTSKTVSPAEQAHRHQYDGPGTYTASATLTFEVQDNSRPFEVDSTCTAVVVVD